MNTETEIPILKIRNFTLLLKFAIALFAFLWTIIVGEDTYDLFSIGVIFMLLIPPVILKIKNRNKPKIVLVTVDSFISIALTSNIYYWVLSAIIMYASFQLLSKEQRQSFNSILKS